MPVSDTISCTARRTVSGDPTSAVPLAMRASSVSESRGRLLKVASLTYAALLIVFSLVRSPVLACVVLLCIGFAMIITNALCNALLQHLVPDHLRGRMMATYSFIVVGVSQVLGSLVAGSIARAFGVSFAIGGAAVIMLGYAYYAFYRRPELRAL